MQGQKHWAEHWMMWQGMEEDVPEHHSIVAHLSSDATQFFSKLAQLPRATTVHALQHVMTLLIILIVFCLSSCLCHKVFGAPQTAIACAGHCCCFPVILRPALAVGRVRTSEEKFLSLEKSIVCGGNCLHISSFLTPPSMTAANARQRK